MPSYSPRHFRALSFHDVVARFRDGGDTPRAYLERCLETIGVREPEVRAWVCLNEAGAREAADASTQRWKAGSPLSPIDGMPIGIKDLLETRDMPTEMGAEALKGNFPKRDNAAVWALREAGAVVLGKTVTAELGGSHPGPTRHPFDPARTPGGSSSGSAAAVAARMVPAAIGTQVAGSIIRPAAYCGNWALKPSQGAINRGERQATSMSTHGAHAGSAEDMWQVMIEIARRAGGDPGRMALRGPDAPPAPRRPATLALMEGEAWPRLDATSRAVFEALVERLREAQVTVLRASDNPALAEFERHLHGVQEMCNSITGWENHWSLRALITNHPDGVSARTKATVEAAERLGPKGYEALLEKREALREAWRALGTLAEAIIAPASPGPAPLWSGDVPGQPLEPRPTGDTVFNTVSSALGAPVVTAPMMAVGGMPFGVQVVGPVGAEAAVTAIARWMGEAIEPVEG
ncbi:amidase [Sabulicella glaciei]|uniref:Amidase n=1 Tax=Sabulicella glaciei TaxID=2984948 RepID=A0ABT3NQR1_9PROT|nr:amidase [Roseococcus sp. MDT2-1-1]MCW8084218.1 amidase [Roseococcus sp. MDT2-1-1]